MLETSDVRLIVENGMLRTCLHHIINYHLGIDVVGINTVGYRAESTG